MQLPLGASGFSIRDLLTLGPLFKARDSSSRGTPRPFASPHSWLECSTALQAGLSTIGLFNFSLPPARYSPVCIIGLQRAALPLLDARMYGGAESPALREKLDLLLGVLKVAGEMWPVARNIGNEVSDALRNVNNTHHGSVMHGFDPELDAFITGMTSSGNAQDPAMFSFPDPKTAEEMFHWGSGVAGLET